MVTIAESSRFFLYWKSDSSIFYHFDFTRSTVESFKPNVISSTNCIAYENWWEYLREAKSLSRWSSKILFYFFWKNAQSCRTMATKGEHGNICLVCWKEFAKHSVFSGSEDQTSYNFLYTNDSYLDFTSDDEISHVRGTLVVSFSSSGCKEMSQPRKSKCPDFFGSSGR